jgi:hypothetical protein
MVVVLILLLSIATARTENQEVRMDEWCERPESFLSLRSVDSANCDQVVKKDRRLLTPREAEGTRGKYAFMVKPTRASFQVVEDCWRTLPPWGSSPRLT